jgi:enoyl-CoA hydratase/carnithine racemase
MMEKRRTGDHRKMIEEAKQYIHYKKDKKNKIAYLTLDRPDKHNAVGAGMRMVYASYIFKANIDDDVKVLVIRGEGHDFGTGADVVEMENLFGFDDMSLLYEFEIDEGEVRYPSNTKFRYFAHVTDHLARARAGCRPLQEFKKISILEVKGYCYGWHFYQSGDADLVICSDDSLFGHAGFRYAGWGPRLWTWIEMMGLRKFQEMLYTGRPFTAKEMYDCGYINSVVPRDKLEAETEKYALACSRSRPTDTVVVQKTFMEMYKQYRGEYFGSLMSGLLEGMTQHMKPDTEEDMAVNPESYKSVGLTQINRDVDMRYPPDFRLARSNRRKP